MDCHAILLIILTVNTEPGCWLTYSVSRVMRRNMECAVLSSTVPTQKTGTSNLGSTVQPQLQSELELEPKLGPQPKTTSSRN